MVGRGVRTAIALVVAAVLNSPLFTLLLSSFKPESAITSPDFRWIFAPTLDNYRQLLVNPDFPLTLYLRNSLIASGGSTLLALVLGIPAAYALARFATGGGFLRDWFLSFRIVPPIVLALPMFILVRGYGLSDNVLSLVLVYLTANIPLAVWVLQSFIRELPQEIEEAALVDGASWPQLLVRVVTPMLAPGAAAVAILTFIFSWNEFLLALVLTFQRGATMPVGAARFITGYSILWGPISAAAIVAAVPTLILGLVVQRHLVRGLTLGAVKE